MDNEPLVLDMLEWQRGAPKPYDEGMVAWRTSCPRLTIWEDAVDAQLVRVRDGVVTLTVAGEAFVSSRRPHSPDVP